MKRITDEKILDEALKYYSDARWNFATTVSQKGYMNRHGKGMTAEEIKIAVDTAKQVDRLRRRFQEQGVKHEPGKG